MSFAVWMAKPPFAFGELDAEQVYAVGELWVVTDQGAPTQAQVDAALAPTADAGGFVEELKLAMGGIVASNGLARAYPLFYPALQAGNWVDLQALIVDARTSGVLSAAQYTAMKDLAAKHHLPVTLPVDPLAVLL